MGYFSNGTEHDMYAAEYCDRCVHNDGCPIMGLHWLWNYVQCGDGPEAKEKAQTLEMFIPRDAKGWNKQCNMFIQIER